MVERANKPSAIPVSPLAPAPQVSISDDNSRVLATLPSGERVEVLLFGATIVSWKSARGKENLFLSDKAHLDGSKAVRGGIPVVFPVFGPPNRDHGTGKLPQHGFARNSRWEYLGKTSSESSSHSSNGGDSSVKLDFGLSDKIISDDTRSDWSHQFGLTYSITLSTDELETSLQVRNTSQEAWEFQLLFHTYLKIDDISKVTLLGLEQTPYVDKVESMDVDATGEAITLSKETDRVYKQAQEQPVTVVEDGKKRFEIVRDMLTDVVVWNPWNEKAKGMSDFGPDDGYKNMICVEAGYVTQWVTLEGGDAWEGGQIIKAL
ncbi:hypothetical protein MMC24_002868 [Lignoscripta atroalba]|nr:hypothetical protein [Lignoscripta atroalba]